MPHWPDQFHWLTVYNSQPPRDLHLSPLKRPNFLLAKPPSVSTSSFSGGVLPRSRKIEDLQARRMDWSTTIHHSAIRTQRRTLRQGLHLTTHVVATAAYAPCKGWALFLDGVQVSWYASWAEKSMGGILFGCFGKKIPGGDVQHLFKGDDFFFKSPKRKHEILSISQTAFARVFWTIKKTWFHNQPQNFCLKLLQPQIKKGIQELFSPSSIDGIGGGDCWMIFFGGWNHTLES